MPQMIHISGSLMNSEFISISSGWCILLFESKALQPPAGIVLMAILGISLWRAGGGMTPERVAINNAQAIGV